MVFCALFAVGGCGKPQGVIFEPLESPLVWPEPPDQPRIRYVGQVSTERDLKKAVSWHEGLVTAIFGKEDIACNSCSINNSVFFQIHQYPSLDHFTIFSHDTDTFLGRQGHSVSLQEGCAGDLGNNAAAGDVCVPFLIHNGPANQDILVGIHRDRTLILANKLYPYTVIGLDANILEFLVCSLVYLFCVLIYTNLLARPLVLKS